MQKTLKWHIKHLMPQRWDSKWQICRCPPTSRLTDKRCYLIQRVQHAEHRRQRLSGKKQTNTFKNQTLTSRIALSCSWCMCCEPKTAPQTLTNPSLKQQRHPSLSQKFVWLTEQSQARLVYQTGWLGLGLHLRALGNDPTWWPQDRLWPEWTEHEPSTFSEPLFIIQTFWTHSHTRFYYCSSTLTLLCYHGWANSLQ